MQTSYSALSEFRQCPRKFAYKRIGRLEQDRPMGLPLIFGQWAHAILAADAIERGIEHESLIQMPTALDACGVKMEVTTDTSPKQIIEACVEWWRTLEGDEREALEQECGKAVPVHLHNTFIRYRQRWADHTATERPLLVEAWAERQVPGTDLILVGVVDEVVRDTTRNIVVVRDHKTMGSWPNQQTIVTEIMDSQLHLYPWLISPLLEGHKPEAIERNMIRSKPPSTPDLTKAGNLSKAVTDYDLHTYEAWLATSPEFPGTKKDGSGAGIYERDEKVVEKLAQETDKFFRRSLRPINLTVIKAHIQAAANDAQRASELTTVEAAPRSPGRHCSWCDFLPLCHAELYGTVSEQYDPAAFGLRPRERTR